MTTVLTYPANILPDSLDWRIKYNTQVFSSPFDNTTQTAESPGARWNCRMNFSNLQPAELRELAGFMASLRGMSGRFTLFDLSLPYPQLATGINSINGGNAFPMPVTILSTRTRLFFPYGASGSNTDVMDDLTTALKVGDYLEMTPTVDGTFVNSGPELKMIIGMGTGADTATNWVDIEPPFRIAPNIVTPEEVTFDNCKTRFMLDSDDQAGWSTTGTIYLSNFTISCSEVF
jgi:hypothetical protein